MTALARLRVRREFLTVAKGSKQVSRGLVLQARKRDPDHPDQNAIRFGLTVTRKVGSAVMRNRAKRRLRALAREVLPVLGKPGFDYVLIGRFTTLQRDFETLRADLRSALRRQHK